MNEALLKWLASNMSQSQAAALAVVIANIREEALTTDTEAPTAIQHLAALEYTCTESIFRNDGNVVFWIGKAAKQMNPLLS